MGKILKKPSKIKEEWEKMGKNSRVDSELQNRIFTPVLESLNFFLSWLFLYLNMYLVDFSSYFYWTIFVYSTAVVQLLYTSTQAALA